MPLYSTDTPSCADESNLKNGHLSNGPEESSLSARGAGLPWCYIFAHRAKVEWIAEKLSREFRVFIHKTVVYTKKKNQIKKKEQPTISGLVFIQGETTKVQSFLNRNFISLYLVKDCSTGLPAVIPHRTMLPFMQIAGVSPSRVRFMPHPFGYYAPGHVLARITSGPLAGLEGYQVRISRDKCLVTSMGGMTVAIGGVCKETFENVDEYVRMRQMQQGTGAGQLAEVLEEFSAAELDKCFFCVQNDMDVVALAKTLDKWVMKAGYLLMAGDHGGAASVLLPLLDGAGRCTKDFAVTADRLSMKPLAETCREAGSMLDTCSSGMAETPHGERIASEKQSMLERYPYIF